MGACFTNIAVTLALRRDNGILKRLRGTPLPPWAFIAGVVGSSIIVSIILALLTTGFGILVYGVNVPQHIDAAAVTIAVGALSFCALGMAMTIFIPNAEAAPAIVNGVFLPIVFISGNVLPRGSVRTCLQRSPNGSPCGISSTRCSPHSTPGTSRRAASTATTC